MFRGVLIVAWMTAYPEVILTKLWSFLPATRTLAQGILLSGDILRSTSDRRLLFGGSLSQYRAKVSVGSLQALMDLLGLGNLGFIDLTE